MTDYPLGKKIAALLDEWGLSQADLAGILGITRSSVHAWIKGKTSPSSRKMKQMADLFKIDPLWFRDNVAAYPPEERYLTQSKASAQSPDEVIASPFLREGMKTQALKAVSSHLFRVNDPELKSLLLELEEVLNHEDRKEIVTLLGDFIQLIEHGTEKKAITMNLLKKRGDAK